MPWALVLRSAVVFTWVRSIGRSTHSSFSITVGAGVLEVAQAVREGPWEQPALCGDTLRIIDLVAGREHVPELLLQARHGWAATLSVAARVGVNSSATVR